MTALLSSSSGAFQARGIGRLPAYKKQEEAREASTEARGVKSFILYYTKRGQVFHFVVQNERLDPMRRKIL